MISTSTQDFGTYLHQRAAKALASLHIQQAAKSQASLHICADLPETLLLACCTMFGSR